MKREILKSFMMLALAVTFGSLTAQAQSANQMKADIPFSFTVGNQTMPAGAYTVRYVNQDSGKTALLFKSEDGRTSRIVNMIPAQKNEPQERAVLVFNQYGDSYFLSEVWTGADQYGLTLPRSRAERKLKENELSKMESKRVTVAFNARP